MYLYIKYYFNMFSNLFKKKEEVKLPTLEHIYTTIFTGLMEKLKNLDMIYFKNTLSGVDTNDIIFEIKNNIEFSKILFEEEKKVNLLDMKIQYDANVEFRKNQFEIIMVDFEISWLKYFVASLLLKEKGNKDNITKKYLEKFKILKDLWQDVDIDANVKNISVELIKTYELILFFNEIKKDFVNIDKNIVKLYVKKYCNELDKINKLRLNSYLMFLLLKNKIKDITQDDLEKIFKYYNDGIDFSLLDEKSIKKMFECLDKYYLDKKIEYVNDIYLIEYENITNANKYISSYDKKQKIKEYKTKYYVYKLNNSLFLSDYKKYINEIFYYVDKLKVIGYELNSKQRRKLNTFKINLDTTEYKFNPKLWFSLFTPEELNGLKEKILTDINTICKVVKNLFPYYKISNDFFCSNINNKTCKLVYDNQKDIYRTINSYCIIMILVGVVNYKLKLTQQEYQIIIKGGKALQLILSEIYFDNKKDIKYESSDIDLIINPIDGVKYVEDKCKNLANNFAFLIKWILNKNENIYDIDTYISGTYGLEYKTLIKLSHKIQKSQDSHELVSYTALVDIDFGEKNNIMYKDLTYDKKISKYGELLFIHQNLDYFLLEKIYYLDYYIKQKNILEKKLENKKIQYTPQEAKIDSNNYKNYERFINKFSSQIKQALKIVFREGEILVKDDVRKYINDLSDKISMNIKVERITDYLL